MVERMRIIRQVICDLDRSLRIQSISCPADGYSKSVYFIACCNNENEHREYVVKFTKTSCATERLFYQLMSASTANSFPVPKIITYGSSTEHYYLASKLPGLPLSQAFTTMADQDKLHIYQRFGRLIGHWHAHHIYQQCGYLEGHKFPNWSTMFMNIVEKQVESLNGTVFEELAAQVKQCLATHIHLIDCRIIPRLLHMDLHRGNILIMNGNISGIVDAEEAIIGHNEYELMRIEKGHFEDDPPNEKYRDVFMCHYQQFIQMDDGYENRCHFYSLSRELVAMRCLIAADNQDHSDETETRQHLERKIHALMARLIAHTR